MTSLLFKNGTLVTAGGRLRADVLVRNGRIAEIREGLSVSMGEASEVIDCAGKFILPGVIDAHVHLRTPGETYKEDFESGTRAAVSGGVTTVLDMPNNKPPITTRVALEAKRALASERGMFANYGFYMGACVDSSGATNVDEFLDSDAVALKVYMGSSTGGLLVNHKEWLEEIFERAAECDRLVCVHAEDEALIREHTALFSGVDDPTMHPKIRDDEVAYRAVKEALHLSKRFGTRLHVCHVSTSRELREIEEFKSDRVSFEVTPHHLFLTCETLATRGNFAKMNPPLRMDADREALMAALRSGFVDMVASDHAPHTIKEKNGPYSEAPAGVPGLETLLPLLLDAVNHGELTLEQVVRVTSAGPVRVFGLEGRGRLDVGAAADLVVLDMELEQRVENSGPGARFTNCGWSVFEGRTLKGWPVMTVVNGRVVFRDNEVSDVRAGREV